MPTLVEDDNQTAHFWARVEVGDASKCWHWKGPPRPDGYGQARVGGRNGYPHRFAMLLSGRPIPDGMVVDHVCRNRICCNPAHLRIVDPATNSVENSVSSPARNAAKRTCVRGHPLEGDNLAIQMKAGRPKRRCRECARIYLRNRGR